MRAVRRPALGVALVVTAAIGAGLAAQVAHTTPPCWSHGNRADTCQANPSTSTTSATTTTPTATSAPTTTSASTTTSPSTTTIATTTTAPTATSASITTTAATTTTAAASSTFDSATAYLDSPLPSLANAIVVSSTSQFSSAIASATAGETIDVLGNVLVPGEFTGFNRVVSGGVVDVVFQPGSGFTGMAGTNLPAVWIHNSGGWRIWGGTITNPAGGGILVYTMPGPFTWTGFTVSDTGNTCVSVFPADGNISGLTLKGVAGTATPNLSLDPHAEKGTGIHAWNLADATGGVLENSTIAADVLNQATGAGVEVEMDRIGPSVTLYARAKHLGFPVPGTTWTGDAQTQVAGNVVQLWGGTPPGSLDVRYAEGNDIQGRIVETSGAYGGASYAHSSIDAGVATGPILQNPLLSKVAYNVGSTGLVLGTVSPLP